MAVGNLNITISLDNGQFTAALNQSGQALRQFTGQVRGANSAVGMAGVNFAKFGTRLRDTVVTLGLARNAILNVWSAFGRLPATMVLATAQFERMQNLLTNMSNADTMASRLADGNKQFEQIIDLARRAPFSIAAIQDSWVKFKSAGLDPANGSMKALLDAVSAFGGSDDILKRASIAIQQMAGKGVISMEELRQQLGEAVPTAMKNLADSMGISVQELAKRVGNGGVQAAESLRNLFFEFNRVFGGQSEKMMQTFSGQLNILRTDMMLFAKVVTEESGLFTTIKTVMGELGGALRSPEVQAAATTIAQAISVMIMKMADLVRAIWEWREPIGTAIKLLGAFVLGVRVIIPALSALAVGFGVATTAAKSFGTYMAVLKLIFAADGVRAGITATLEVLRSFLMLTPARWVALMVGALTAVAGWLWVTRDAADEAADAINRYWDSATPEQIDKSKKSLEGYRNELKAINNQLKAGGSVVGGAFVPFSAKEKAQLKRQADEKAAEITKLEGNIALAEAEAKRKNTEQSSRLFMLQAKNEVEAIKQTSKTRESAERAAIDRLVETKQLTAAQAATRWRDFTIANEKKETEQIMALLERRRKAQQAILASTTASADEKKTAFLNVKGIEEEIKAAQDALNGIISGRMNGIPDANNLKAEKDPLSLFMQQTQIKIARYRAQLDGEKEMAQEVAAFLEEIEMAADGKSGTFRGKTYSAKALEDVQALVAEMAAKKDAVQNYNNLLTQQKYSFDQLATLAESTGAELATWADAANNGGINELNNKLLSATKQIAKLRENVVAAGGDLAKFDQQAAKVLADTRAIAAAEKIDELTKLRMKNELELITNSEERHRVEMTQFSAEIEAYILRNQLTSEQTEKIRQVTAAILEQRQQMFDMSTPLRSMAEDWKNQTENMKKSTAGWISAGVDAFVEFAATGKATFGDLAKSILKDILRIILRALIAQAILSAIGVKPGQTASTGSSFKDILANMFGANIETTKNAKGNIMTSDGPMPLQRYAAGGIARRPQVAIFGEGSMAEAYVPLPDGRSIPVTLDGAAGGASPNVTVNVINQSNSQVTAEQRGQPRFDGNGYVLDVVLKAMNQPGSFRDSMRSAVR
jgi:tape measure domain-containing protein